MAPLAKLALDHPIRDPEDGRVLRTHLQVGRYATLQDFIECEERGYLLDGEIKPSAVFKALGYFLWQLCGVPPDELGLLDTRQLPKVQEFLDPFVRSAPPPTGEPGPQT